MTAEQQIGALCIPYFELHRKIQFKSVGLQLIILVTYMLKIDNTNKVNCVIVSVLS